MSFSPDQLGLLTPEQQEQFLNGPALASPDDRQHNLQHPENNNSISYFVCIVSLILSTGFISTRLFARCLMKQRLEWEEGLALAAFGCYVPYIAYTLIWTKDVGYFVHQWDISVNNLIKVLWITHICSTFYAVVMGVMKAVTLREWARIFAPGIRNSFWWACHTVMALNLVFYAICIVLQNISATPYRRCWDITVPGTTRVDPKLAPLVGGCINVVFDLVILMIPQKVIWGLNMSTRKKVGVSCLFTVGLLCCGAAIARLVYTVRYFQTDDVAYSIPGLSLWSIAEMTCMFMIYCSPTFPLVVKNWSKMKEVAPKLSEPTESSWPGSDANGSSSRSKYKRMNEYELPLVESQSVLNQ